MTQKVLAGTIGVAMGQIGGHAKARKVVLSTIGIMLSILVVFASLSIFRTPDIRMCRGITESYYSAPKNTLQVAIVGPSPTYCDWTPTIAYEETGMCGRNLSGSALSESGMEYYITESMKNQSLKVIAVELTDFGFEGTAYTEPDSMKIHVVSDCMPWSSNKLALINDQCKMGNFSGIDCMEYYLPFVRFHNRWQTLTSYDFGAPTGAVGGKYDSDSDLASVREKGLSYTLSQDSGQLSEQTETLLNNLLDYCDQIKQPILFYFSPSSINCSNYARSQQIQKIINERGYRCINFNDAGYYEKIGLDTETDFRDHAHMNALGSMKFTRYFARILTDDYGLEDMRENPNYSSWSTDAAAYDKMLGEYLGK